MATSKDFDFISSPITLQEFEEKYFAKNKPCIIGNWLVKDWSCFQDWFTKDGSLDLDKLSNIFGHASVNVLNCNTNECNNMRFSDFIEEAKKNNEEPLYIKDWHVVKEFPQEKIYETPLLFENDWLNDFCIAATDSDFKFMYFGFNGSFTPLHADVFRSYSWSTNISGKKKWIFYPPEVEDYLTDINGNLLDDISDVDTKLYSYFHLAQNYKIEAYQTPGQTVFVPSNWFHCVYNEGLTLSINHNFFNRINVKAVVSYYFRCLKNCEKEVADLLEPPINMKQEEWRQVCQDLQKQHFGLTGNELIEILNHRLKSEKATAEDLEVVPECLKVLKES